MESFPSQALRWRVGISHQLSKLHSAQAWRVGWLDGLDGLGGDLRVYGGFGETKKGEHLNMACVYVNIYIYIYYNYIYIYPYTYIYRYKWMLSKKV